MIEEVFPGLDANELLELWSTFADDERKIENIQQQILFMQI